MEGFGADTSAHGTRRRRDRDHDVHERPRSRSNGLRPEIRAAQGDGSALKRFAVRVDTTQGVRSSARARQVGPDTRNLGDILFDELASGRKMRRGPGPHAVEPVEGVDDCAQQSSSRRALVTDLRVRSSRLTSPSATRPCRGSARQSSRATRSCGERGGTTRLSCMKGSEALHVARRKSYNSGCGGEDLCSMMISVWTASTCRCVRGAPAFARVALRGQGR